MIQVKSVRLKYIQKYCYTHSFIYFDIYSYILSELKSCCCSINFDIFWRKKVAVYLKTERCKIRWPSNLNVWEYNLVYAILSKFVYCIFGVSLMCYLFINHSWQLFYLMCNKKLSARDISLYHIPSNVEWEF